MQGPGLCCCAAAPVVQPDMQYASTYANPHVTLARRGCGNRAATHSYSAMLCISYSGLWREAPMPQVVAGRAPRLKEVAVQGRAAYIVQDGLVHYRVRVIGVEVFQRRLCALVTPHTATSAPCWRHVCPRQRMDRRLRGKGSCCLIIMRWVYNTSVAHSSSGVIQRCCTSTPVRVASQLHRFTGAGQPPRSCRSTCRTSSRWMEPRMGASSLMPPLAFWRERRNVSGARSTVSAPAQAVSQNAPKEGTQGTQATGRLVYNKDGLHIRVQRPALQGGRTEAVLHRSGHGSLHGTGALHAERRGKRG